MHQVEIKNFDNYRMHSTNVKKRNFLFVLAIF